MASASISVISAKRSIRRARLVKAMVYTVVAVSLLITLAPFYWALNMSFKREGDVFNIPIQYFPNPFTAANYVQAWTFYNFGTYFSNSLRVAIAATLLVLVCATMNGYALSRFKFKGKTGFMLLLLSSQMLPGVFTLIPLFVIFRHLGLLNSLLGLTIVYIGNGIPFNTLLMYGFVNGIPNSIDEAAMVDGASRSRIIIRIILPLIVPGLVATSAFAFISAWNEFFAAFAILSTRRLFTISIAIRFLTAEGAVHLASMAAQCIIALAPPLILFAIIQKHLVQGLTAGAVKS